MKRTSVQVQGIQGFDELVHQNVRVKLWDILGNVRKARVLGFMHSRYEELLKFSHHRLSERSINEANDMFAGSLVVLTRDVDDLTDREWIVVPLAYMFISMTFLLPGES